MEGDLGGEAVAFRPFVIGGRSVVAPLAAGLLPSSPLVDAFALASVVESWTLGVVSEQPDGDEKGHTQRGQAPQRAHRSATEAIEASPPSARRQPREAESPLKTRDESPTETVRWMNAGGTVRK